MLRLAIIGCGGMSTQHLEAYRAIKAKEPEKFEFTAMCDVIRDSAQRFADQAAASQGSKPQVYTSVDEMLAKEHLDAADICTPHSDHHISGIKCLDSGINIMTEKPFGVTVKASKAMIEAAKRNGKIACVAEQVRRGPGPRTVHWLINDNKMIGEPRLFFVQLASWANPSRVGRWTWRSGLMYGGGGGVIDGGAHFADTIRYIYGDPDTVYARSMRLDKRLLKKGDEVVPSETEDTSLSTITFKSGVTGFWSMTTVPGYSYMGGVYYASEGCIIDRTTVAYKHPFWVSPGPRTIERIDADVVVQKEAEKIIYPLSALCTQFMNTLSEERKNALFPHGSLSDVYIECYDFLDAIEKGRQPEVYGEEALKSKAICEAVYESSALGEAVKFEDVLSGKIEEYQKPINEYWGL